ncbi:hypothetical protein QCA50_002570 [Cerrena zonata]|uniref:Uncharacterized protein n=1 Tax=Cerrena zonata TaxID=2478898 RepID=A0AAW0GPN5_9APHY
MSNFQAIQEATEGINRKLLQVCRRYHEFIARFRNRWLIPASQTAHTINSHLLPLLRNADVPFNQKTAAINSYKKQAEDDAKAVRTFGRETEAFLQTLKNIANILNRENPAELIAQADTIVTGIDTVLAFHIQIVNYCVNSRDYLAQQNNAALAALIRSEDAYMTTMSAGFVAFNPNLTA